MPAKKAPAAALSYAVGEKVTALWTDGKWYDAIVKKAVTDTKYQITYTAYGTSLGST